MLVLETERLTLRWLDYGDAEFILALLNEPSFIEFIGDKGVRDLDGARRYLDEGPLASYQRFGFGLYWVGLKSSHQPLGICGLLKRDELEDADLGFAFLPAYWAQGYARESAAAVMRLGWEAFGLKRIVAITSPHNRASQKLLAKLGFRDAGERRIEPDSEAVSFFIVDRAGVQPAGN